MNRPSNTAQKRNSRIACSARLAGTGFEFAFGTGSSWTGESSVELVFLDIVPMDLCTGSILRRGGEDTDAAVVDVMCLMERNRRAPGQPCRGFSGDDTASGLVRCAVAVVSVVGLGLGVVRREFELLENALPRPLNIRKLLRMDDPGAGGRGLLSLRRGRLLGVWLQAEGE